MLIVPSIDIEGGRSRLVYWPGAATGIGAPTDQPARIARMLVDQGAELIHLVDFDGARAGAPANLAAVGAVAGLVATPLQLAAFPWRQAGPKKAEEIIDDLAAVGVMRVVLSHGGGPSEAGAFAQLVRRQPTMELTVAGGVQNLDGIRRLRDAGVAALILGEPLFSGAISLDAARSVADPRQ